MGEIDVTPSAPPTDMHRFVEQWDGHISTGSPRPLLETLVRIKTILNRASAFETPGSSPGSMLLNLTSCTSVDPGGVLLVAELGARLKRAGWTPFLNTAGRVNRLILKHLDHYLQPKEKRRKQVTVSEYLMRGIERREEMIDELESWGRELKRRTSASDESIALWQMQIAEVTTNGFQHGGPGQREVVVAGTRRAKRREVQLASHDDGAGIPASIARALAKQTPPLTDAQLIEYACRDGVTARSEPENQGAGLPTLLRTLRQNDSGRLLIASGDGVFYFNGTENQLTTLPADLGSLVTGTLTVITLRI